MGLRRCLQALLPMTSLAHAAAPPTTPRRQCTTSYDIDRAWHLSFLHYENLPVPKGQPPVGHINMTMRTDLNDYAVTCDTVGEDISQLKQIHSKDIGWRNCTSPSDPDIKTVYKFSWERGGLVLETRQEWLCDNGKDADPDEPSTQVSAGQGWLHLYCNDSIPIYDWNYCQTNYPIATVTPFIETFRFPPRRDCTDASFTTPGWEIQNLYIDTDLEMSWGSGTVGDMTFDVRNTANGYQFSCHVGSSADNWLFDQRIIQDGKVWYSCNLQYYTPQNALATQVYFDMDTKELGINQTWVCDDLGTPVTFHAIGFRTVILQCHRLEGQRQDEVACNRINTTIPATLRAPLDYAPAWPVDAAPGDRTAIGCTAASGSPTWKVSNLWRKTWMTAAPPFGGGSGSATQLDFNLYNGAINYTTSCSVLIVVGGLILGEPLPGGWSVCQSVANEFQPVDGVKSFAKYDSGTGTVTVNQSWYCSDQNSREPTVFTAVGSEMFLLYCNGTDLPNFYTSNCTARPFDVHPTSVDVQHIRKSDLASFDPHPYSCTTHSLLPMEWELRGWTESITWTERWNWDPWRHERSISFSVYNSMAAPKAYSQSRGADCGIGGHPAQTYGGPGHWYECQNYHWPFATKKWMYDNTTEILSLNFTWTCNDKNQDRPILFTALGNLHIDEKCDKRQITPTEKIPYHEGERNCSMGTRTINMKTSWAVL